MRLLLNGRRRETKKRSGALRKRRADLAKMRETSVDEHPGARLSAPVGQILEITRQRVNIR